MVPESKSGFFLKFIRNYRILKNTPRSGWLSCGIRLNEVENVADHTLDVAVLSMLLIDLFRENKFNVDGEKVLRIALVHDLEEAKLTDIPYPCKKYLKGLSGAKEEIAKEIFSESGKKEYLGLWKAKKEESAEGDIVGIADLLSMIYEHAEIRRRFKSPELDEHLKNCLSDLKPFIMKYKFIEEIIPEFNIQST